MELSSGLTLEMLGKPFLLEKRIVLLHAIQEYGSISKAAKAVPMSYKSAWEAVDMMNSLSPDPIVCREAGGKDGGGTTITSYGKRLLDNYALLKDEHTRFIERLSELTDVENGTFNTIGRLAMHISARNQIQAEVLNIESHDLNAKVVLKFKSGQVISSIITQEAVEDMHIEVGQTVTAIFKSSNVVLSDVSTIEGDYNNVEGRVVKLEKDKEHTKVTVDIGNHDKIVSVISSAKMNILKLDEGTHVYVQIKYNDVMLGK